MGETEQQEPGKPDQAKPEGDGVDRAFDLWLRRGLHQLYDTVAKEPVPDALLKLIEEDRAEKEK